MNNKRNHFVLITLFMMFLLAGCGRNDKVKETSTPVVSPTTAGLADPDALPETVIVHPENTVPTTHDTHMLETEPPAPSVEAVPAQPPSQTQSAASGMFTGVQGTEFTVPEGFIQLDESPNIGYQYTFWHPDYEIRIVVYEIAPGYIPEGAYETDFSVAKKNPDVTYFSNGVNWFVQSGYNNSGEEIFYSKECSTDKGLKTFWITYPTAKREFGDTISADFEKNCRF